MIDRLSLSLTREQAASLEEMPLTAAWSIVAEALERLAPKVEMLQLPQVEDLTPTERMALRTGVELSALVIRNSVEDLLASQVEPD